MIFWKEWRVLRLRFLVLTAFYGITLIFIPLIGISPATYFEAIPNYLIMFGAGMLIIPVIIGMDAYVGERDQETEEFLMSKPVSFMRMLAAKVGLRFLLTFVLTISLLAIALVRVIGTGTPLYLDTRPYMIWFLILYILTAQMLVLMTTITVSIRAPFQSTALIVGGALGTAVSGLLLTGSLWKLSFLQVDWVTFYLEVGLLILMCLLAASFLYRKEVGRSVP